MSKRKYDSKLTNIHIFSSVPANTDKINCNDSFITITSKDEETESEVKASKKIPVMWQKYDG